MDALPEEFRTVFVLREVEGLSTAETAASLAIRPETVKTRLHRARRLLQERLSERLLPLSPSLFEFQGRRCDRVVGRVLARLPAPPGGPADHAHPGRARAPAGSLARPALGLSCTKEEAMNRSLSKSAWLSPWRSSPASAPPMPPRRRHPRATRR